MRINVILSIVVICVWYTQCQVSNHNYKYGIYDSYPLSIQLLIDIENVNKVCFPIYLRDKHMWTNY